MYKRLWHQIGFASIHVNATTIKWENNFSSSDQRILLYLTQSKKSIWGRRLLWRYRWSKLSQESANCKYKQRSWALQGRTKKVKDYQELMPLLSCFHIWSIFPLSRQSRDVPPQHNIPDYKVKLCAYHKLVRTWAGVQLHQYVEMKLWSMEANIPVYYTELYTISLILPSFQRYVSRKAKMTYNLERS